MANPRYRQPLMAYDPRFQGRASQPNPMLGQLMAWLLANQIAQQAEAPEEVVQTTEEVPAVNPYIGNIYRPSPRVGSLSALGRFNDMRNRMEAERQQRFADARQAVAQTYANQPQQDPAAGGVVEIAPNNRALVGSKYGTGSSVVDPEMSYEDFLAQRHNVLNNPKPPVPAVGWDDPRLLDEINAITKRVIGGRR